MRIQAIRAWPRRFDCVELELPEGSTVADALRALPFDAAGYAGFAIHGEQAMPGTVLREGDRLELLRALLIDPKAARRRRAARPPR